MGPRASARGNPIVPTVIEPLILLQWGRAHLRAEIGTVVFLEAAGARLQWGRAHLRAEMRSADALEQWRAQLQWGRAHLRAEMLAI